MGGVFRRWNFRDGLDFSLVSGKYFVFFLELSEALFFLDFAGAWK
jgi:hypothetical protein